MTGAGRHRAAWITGGLALMLAGAVALVRIDIVQRREAFQADARIAHRVLSQRAAQHDAILATLALLATAQSAPEAQRLVALYPQLLAVRRRDAATPWPDAALADAEARSQAQRNAAVLGPVDGARHRYALVRAGALTSWALEIDAQRLLGDDWPLQRDGPVQALLVHGADTLPLQPGAPDAARAGLTPGFVYAKTLAPPSQPFELRLQRSTGALDWPWRWLLAWALVSAAAVRAAFVWQRERAARRRSEELMRLAQAARLNTLGELAAGVAHELNQPLTAVLASTQAAARVLADPDGAPDLPTVRQALELAGAQARRAADVLARLRRLVQPAQPEARREAVALQPLLQQLLSLLQPELARHGASVRLAGSAPAVRADAVAVEQIAHNLLTNAMQALDTLAPAEPRAIVLELASDGQRATLAVRDNGPGIAADALPRVFEPFYTTRPGGLGLGLALCESLAQAMDGSLSARAAAPRGAEFVLALPLAEPDPRAAAVARPARAAGEALR